MNLVIFASDAKGLSSLNSIIQVASERGVRIFAMVTNSTQLKYPLHQQSDFEILSNVGEEKVLYSKSLGVYLPFKPDWLLVSRERWNPEEDIIKEFKLEFKAKVGLVEPNSWILGGIESKLETESRNRFKDLIDVFFTHSNHSKLQQMTLGFKGNMEVVGNPKYDLNLTVSNEDKQQLQQYYKIDPNKKQILLFSLVNSNRTNINKIFKEYIEQNPQHQYFYKPYPGEPFDSRFRNEYYPKFFLDNCTPILEENHVWGMFNICDTHIGCISSITHSTLLLNKEYIDLSRQLNIKEQYLDVSNILKKEGVGIENNVGMWLRTFKLSSPEQLKELVNTLLIEKIKQGNNKVWDSLDNPSSLIKLFDEYNDNNASKRILNYILNGNL